MAKYKHLKLFAVVMASVIIGGGILWFVFGGQIPTTPLTGYQYTTEQACTVAGGTWANGQCKFQPTPTGYVPFTLSNVYMTVMNSLDKDATFGADDAYVRVYEFGKFDFVGPYLDSDGNAATSGQIDLAGKKLHTGTSYTALAYQGDGGTALYAYKFDFTIPQLTGDKTLWNYPTTIYLSTEGTFTESALDSSTLGFDEGNETADVVTLNKTRDTVQGCLIEHIYLSVKSGSGVSFPSGDLVSEFRTATPIHVTSDEELGSADGVTGTLKVCFPAAEASVGTGDFLMHFDDLGDYRNRDLDNDVRAADETTTFDICT